jgi:hypothetical protein
MFYGKINSSALRKIVNSMPSGSPNPFPTDIQMGMNATKNTFIFDDNNTIIEY